MTQKTIDILVIGEVNADLVLTGDVTPAFGQAEKLIDDATLTSGSSGAIFACGAARLGHIQIHQAHPVPVRGEQALRGLRVAHGDVNFLGAGCDQGRRGSAPARRYRAACRGPAPWRRYRRRCRRRC